MLLLCLDASLSRSGAALVRAGAVVAEAASHAVQGQAGAIALHAAEVLARGGAEAPDAVAVTIGPGSFTGLRAAGALAHGLAAGWGVPLVAVTTAEALALPLIGASPVAVLIDSRRGHRFLQLFDAVATLPHPRGPAVAVAAAALAAIIPPGAVTVGDSPEAQVSASPRLADVARLAEARLGGALPPLPPLPLYLDPPAARPAAGLRPPPAA